MIHSTEIVAYRAVPSGSAAPSTSTTCHSSCDGLKNARRGHTHAPHQGAIRGELIRRVEAMACGAKVELGWAGSVGTELLNDERMRRRGRTIRRSDGEYASEGEWMFDRSESSVERRSSNIGSQASGENFLDLEAVGLQNIAAFVSTSVRGMTR